MLDRRQFLLLSATAAAAGLSGGGRPGWAAAPSSGPGGWPGYAQALVIDGLGSPGGTSDGFLRAEQIADVRASGLTAVNLTVSTAVGVLTGAFEAGSRRPASPRTSIPSCPT